MRLPIRAAVVIATVLLPTVPLTGVRAVASPIQHVVVIYQENHTFDNVLGAWCNTTSPPRCDGGPTGTSTPVALADGAKVVMQPSPDIVPDVNHSVPSQLQAIDAGKMDGWDQIKGCQASSTPHYGCLTYYTPANIPNLTNLAAAFGVADRFFSMKDSPTWGGHFYAVAATTDHFTGDNPRPASGVTQGPGWGCNSNRVALWVDPVTGATSQQPSCVPDPALGLPNGGAFRPTLATYVPTIMDRLDAGAWTWKIYASFASGFYAACPTFAECEYSPQNKNVVVSSSILSDAQSGRLPNFALVTPTAANSQHNIQSMAAGDNWIGSVVSAIEHGPQWGSTAIFVTYDDCGCFYDHVPPPKNPDGTQQGPRSPLVIASPYAIAGHTDSTPASFASILAFVESTFGLAPLSQNDAQAYAFQNAFNYAQVPLAGARMVQSHVLFAPSGPDDPSDTT